MYALRQHASCLTFADAFLYTETQALQNLAQSRHRRDKGCVQFQLAGITGRQHRQHQAQTASTSANIAPTEPSRLKKGFRCLAQQLPPSQANAGLTHPPLSRPALNQSATRRQPSLPGRVTPPRGRPAQQRGASRARGWCRAGLASRSGGRCAAVGPCQTQWSPAYRVEGAAQSQWLSCRRHERKHRRMTRAKPACAEWQWFERTKLPQACRHRRLT
jgi:hypothetical protein